MKKTYFLLLALSITTLGFGQDSDSNIVSSSVLGIPVQSNIDYTAYSATSGLIFDNLASDNSVFLGEFTINDFGTSDGLSTRLTDISFTISYSEDLAAIAIYTGLSTPAAEITVVNPTTTFSGLNIEAPDSGTKQFFIIATFKSAVTDNDQIQLTISDATAVGSTFAFPVGGASTPATGDINRIEVTASQFQFNQQPTDGNKLEVMSPFPSIFAVDGNLNQDLDTNITGISVTSSGTVVPETYDMTSGQATLNNVVFTGTETGVTLIASSAVPNFSGTSSTFDINGPLVNIAEQNFDSATGWSFSTGASFGTITDWAGNRGYYGPIALADASPIDYSLFSDEIFGQNYASGDPLSQILTFDYIDISAINSVSIEFDWQGVDYDNFVSNHIEYRVALNGLGFSGSWTLVFGGNAFTNKDQGRVKIPISDASTSVRIQVRIVNDGSPRPESTYTGLDNFRLVSQFNGLVYTASGGGWQGGLPPNLTTGALDALVLDGTYDVTGDVQIDNLIINSGAATVIGSGGSITTNSNITNKGTLELNSISDNYSSLIVGGSITNEVIYNRHVNVTGSGSTGNNDLISAPVTNTSQTFGGFRAANVLNLPSGVIGPDTFYLFGPYDNNSLTNPYVLYSDSDDAEILTAGKGYRTASTNNSAFTFTGDVQTGPVSVGITIGSVSDWNLIGNPYPSYINLLDFLTANSGVYNPLTEGVYGYDGNASDGWTIWNQAFAIDPVNANALIAPGQGFFVSSLTGSETINFTPAMRSIGNADDFIPGRPADQNFAHLKLLLSNGDASYNTDFYFNDNASLGMDPGYDSGLFNNTTPNFAMYSHLVENNTGNDMAVQSVSYSDLDNVTIPLGINIAQGEQVTVSILESRIPEGITVFLEDNVSNTFTDLKAGDYTFTPTTTLTETGRFYIHLSRGTLGTTENVLNGLEIYTVANPKTIIVKGLLEDKTTFQLYDIQGRLVNTQLLNTNDTTHTIDVSSLAAGIYVVQLQNTTGNRTQKVILN